MELNEEFYNIQKNVKCIDGVPRTYNKCIGFCNNLCHKGFVTSKLLIEHECIEKNCTFFDPIKNHPYWIKREAKKQYKAEIKELNKMHKHLERLILEKAKESSPTDIEFVMCKHLYDSTYVLIVIKSNLSVVLPEEFLEEFAINVYIKSIHERQRANIPYTYKFLLPEDMRNKLSNS